MNKLAMDVFNVNKNKRLKNNMLMGRLHSEKREMWEVLELERVYPIRKKR